MRVVLLAASKINNEAVNFPSYNSLEVVVERTGYSFDFSNVFGTRTGVLDVNSWDIVDVGQEAANFVDQGLTEGLMASRNNQQRVVDYHIRWRHTNPVNNDASGMRQPTSMVPIVEEVTQPSEPMSVSHEDQADDAVQDMTPPASVEEEYVPPSVAAARFWNMEE